jgi:serine/threonine protein kinase
MGEVWKARDTRLDRVVAIKTIQGPFSERFEREARAISALNRTGSRPEQAGRRRKARCGDDPGHRL